MPESRFLEQARSLRSVQQANPARQTRYMEVEETYLLQRLIRNRHDDISSVRNILESDCWHEICNYGLRSELQPKGSWVEHKILSL